MSKLSLNEADLFKSPLLTLHSDIHNTLGTLERSIVCPYTNM